MGRRIMGMLCCLGAALFLALPAAAFGGDVDFGGGDSGGGYSGGGDYGYDSYDSYSDYSSSSDSSRSSSPLEVVLNLSIVAVILLVFSRKRGANRSKKAGRAQKIPAKKTDEESLGRLQEADRYFDRAALEAEVREWVFRFEDAWCAMDMTPCRAHISDGLFDDYQKMLAEMRKNKEVPVTFNLVVKECGAECWYRRGGSEFLDMWILEEKKTYVASAYNRNNILKGNAHTLYRLYYRWQLVREENGRAWQLNRADKLAQVNLI